MKLIPISKLIFSNFVHINNFNMRKILLAFLLVCFFFANAQTELVFVFFKDKPNKAEFYANPLSELTQKSLNRRTKFGIALDDRDAPVSYTHLDVYKRQNLYRF